MVVCQLFPAAMRAALGLGMTARRFPPPWSVEETDACFIVRDHDGRDIAKLPELLRRAPACALFDRCPSSCSSHSAISTLDASGFKLTRVRLLLAKPTKYQAET